MELKAFYSSHDNEPFDDDPPKGRTGFSFWHCTDVKLTHGKKKPCLPSVDFDGLSSAVVRGGFKNLVLLSYQSVPCPAGVELVDANHYLEEGMR